MTHQLSDYDRETLELVDSFVPSHAGDVADRVRAVIVALANAREENQRLVKQITGDHRGYIESRRSICEQSDGFKADLAAAVVARDKAEAEIRKSIADELERKISDWSPHCSQTYIRGIRAALLYVTGEAHRPIFAAGLDGSAVTRGGSGPVPA